MATTTTTETATLTSSQKLKPEDWPKYEGSGLFEPDGKNQIYFKADNQTVYNLAPRSDYYAYWGDFSSGPTTFGPYTVGGAGHLISSLTPLVGSLGIVGFTITGRKNTVYAVLLGSNPYLSVRDNAAYVQLLSTPPYLNKPTLNKLYDAETNTASIGLNGKTLRVVASIGQAEEATATFQFSWT